MSSMIPTDQIKTTGSNSKFGDPKLDALFEKAMAVYNAMSPLEKQHMHFEQRVSWIYGEIGIENPDDIRTRDNIRTMIREMDGIGTC